MTAEVFTIDKMAQKSKIRTKNVTNLRVIGDNGISSVATLGRLHSKVSIKVGVVDVRTHGLDFRLWLIDVLSNVGFPMLWVVVRCLFVSLPRHVDCSRFLLMENGSLDLSKKIDNTRSTAVYRRFVPKTLSNVALHWKIQKEIFGWMKHTRDSGVLHDSRHSRPILGYC